MTVLRTCCLSWLLAVSLAAPAWCKTASAEPTPEALKPYATVIPSSATTLKGVFIVHRVKEKVYYEIPPPALGRDFLWVTTFARVQTGFEYAGTEVQNRVVRWIRHDDRVLLTGVSYDLTSEEPGAVRRAVEANSLGPVIMAFDMATRGPDDAPVIDVTNLFVSGVAEVSPSGKNFKHPDEKRSYVDGIKDFPQNLETEALLTYKLDPETKGRRLQDGLWADDNLATLSVLLHHSMVLLPEDPMMPRLADSRIGYFTESHLDFSPRINRAETRRFIDRWRLEKKDTLAAVSEPVKPIVYYIGREVPEKWRPWIKKGVEDWQPAFEQAGFKNAIVAKDAPDPKDDPDWDPDDVRYSTIRWLPSTIENAYGPSITDPRSGEILNANIKFFHNILKLVTTWYFVQASPADPRARTMPLSDELTGELLECITTHEVGHTLGLRHNMKASSAYTVEQLRDPAFTERNGTEASIMAYGRFNYVAQPGDRARLIPKLGPYDRFAIEWGYKPIGAITPDAEKPALDEIAGRQAMEPVLRFGDANPGEDPLRQTEDLGSDPIAATALGLKNIDRIMDWIVPATCKFGEDYHDLDEMYDALLVQRREELGHVVAVVGGVNQTDWHFGRGRAVYAPVPAGRQREAVRFLLEHAFQTPHALISPDVLGRLTAGGYGSKLLTTQGWLLRELLDPGRLARMSDQIVLHGSGYAPAELMADVRTGLWSELAAPAVSIDPYRRNLQRFYIESLKDWADTSYEAANNPGNRTLTTAEVRPLARGALDELRRDILAAQPRTKDPATRLHLDYCAAAIHRILTGH